MPRYVVPDTSAIAAALYNESYTLQAEPLLEAIRKGSVDAVAPSSGLTEFLNVSRKKLISSGSHSASFVADVEAIVADFLTLPILWWEISAIAPSAWRLHRSQGVETGDAFFLEVARQWDAEIWTLDEQFYRTAHLAHPKTFDLRTIRFV
jgi:predicted nucleic acid-binding protein